jgi:alkanesulfonate monooxygenase SsuD/methylene tetrahydromethanopterin reductase-like flavin-dependent oxidoreductase (luciferase family)
VKLGITLPSMIPGTDRDLLLGWARRADDGPFSCLSTGELVASPSHDAMTTLAAAAAVTSRVRLMTNVLALPLHREGLLAKAAASIDVLSGGRLTLGIGIGGKKPMLFKITADQAAHSNYPDYAAAPAPYERRAERLTDQIAVMRRIWAGGEAVEGSGPVGPPPVQAGGPELLVGGFAPAAIGRATAWAAGLTTFSHQPDLDRIEADFAVARTAWAEAGKGEPRLVAACYFALGPDAEAGRDRFVRTHYHHLGADGQAKIGAAITATSAAALRDVLRRCEDLGADEVVPVPMIPSLDQVDRLAELAPTHADR